ncbi:MAG: nucleotidyltransferase family protein [Alphaproteobacteria bacterium]
MFGGGAQLDSFDRPGLWPTAEQTQVLKAALFEDQRAIDAFSEWRAGIDIADDFGYDVLRLLPLVFHNLHRLGVRDPLMGRLKGTYRMSWVKNHKLFAAIAPVIEALQSAGVDVMLLKGAPLVASYYRNPALRPMADVDLLIRPRDVDVAIRTVVDMGWHSFAPFSNDYRRFRHALQFIDEAGTEFDLHWHALYEFCQDAADDVFWRDAERFDFAGLSVVMPNPSLMLFHTVVHGVRWNEEPPIRWIADATQILRCRNIDLDWDLVVRLAVDRQVVERLRLGLEYLHATFDAPMPRHVLSTLQDHRSTLLEWIEARSVLRNRRRFYRTPIGSLWIDFSEYCRWARRSGPIRFGIDFSHFLRFRWNLEGRSEIPGMILRGTWKRLAGPAP